MFSSDCIQKMNRINSLVIIIITSITLGAFLVFNTYPLMNVLASEERSEHYYPPAQDYQPENGYNSDIQYNQERYGEFSDQYESGYYEDHYGKPYKIN
jgi:hypothetical protein